jgi:hypothetical protein
MIDDECGTVDGMRIDKGNLKLGENLPNCHLVHRKARMT